MASTLKQMTSKVNTYDADVKTTDADVKTIDIDDQTNDIEGQYKGNRRSIQWQSKVNTKASDNVTIAIEGQYIRRSTSYMRHRRSIHTPLNDLHTALPAPGLRRSL